MKGAGQFVRPLVFGAAQRFSDLVFRRRGAAGNVAAVAKRTKKPVRKKQPARRPFRPVRTALRYGLIAVSGAFVLLVALILLFRVVNPPTTHTIRAESRRLGAVDWQWVPIANVAPATVRAVVAAEDANFCGHWGFDMAAIRAALDDGASRGASTISQQTVKNVFLWQGRSWPRKALEAVLTPMVEAMWPKRRILEVYLNVAEFGEGVFGIEAASHHYFRVPPADLTAAQGARLAVLLPNPKQRDPAQLPQWLRKHAGRVQDGAETIKADGRASCFES